MHHKPSCTLKVNDTKNHNYQYQKGSKLQLTNDKKKRKESLLEICLKGYLLSFFLVKKTINKTLNCSST